MKRLLMCLLPVWLVGSCVFEEPFESAAKIPTDDRLLGRWEEITADSDAQAKRMLVLPYAKNEYVVAYPTGDSAMYFRAFAVNLAGADYIQVQLIGTAEKPVAAGDRKFHLLEIAVKGDDMEMRLLKPEVIGKVLKDSAAMKAAFAKHKDDPELFDKPVKFKRIPQAP